ncbi:hypothetical protein C4569_01960 [Candidatus Parcubacteria bacterium]|nr:MAG: hypothetical protein C4569_01960 [Candidatus Parcubacteria bacterium]
MRKLTEDKIAKIYWKRLSDFWGLFTISLFTVDFFTGGGMRQITTAIAVIYISILGIFIGEKEYLRWKNIYISKFFGEGYIILWTTILVILVIISSFSRRYHFPEQMSVVYISVLTFYFASLRSKILKKRRLAK